MPPFVAIVALDALLALNSVDLSTAGAWPERRMINRTPAAVPLIKTLTLTLTHFG